MARRPAATSQRLVGTVASRRLTLLPKALAISQTGCMGSMSCMCHQNGAGVCGAGVLVEQGSPALAGCLRRQRARARMVASCGLSLCRTVAMTGVRLWARTVPSDRIKRSVASDRWARPLPRACPVCARRPRRPRFPGRRLLWLMESGSGPSLWPVAGRARFRWRGRSGAVPGAGPRAKPARTPGAD